MIRPARGILTPVAWIMRSISVSIIRDGSASGNGPPNCVQKHEKSQRASLALNSSRLLNGSRMDGDSPILTSL